MTDFYVVQFGKAHKGEPIVKVAVEAYPDFAWLLQHDGFLSKRYQDINRRLDHALNNYVPATRCKFPEGCDDVAKFLSVVLELPFGMSASTAYGFCGNHIGYGLSLNPKAAAHPIKFNTILGFPSRPLWVREDVTKVLLETTGFTGRKTRERLERHIDGLPLYVPYQEPAVREKPKPVATQILLPIK